jgi:hypothetical protein
VNTHSHRRRPCCVSLAHDMPCVRPETGDVKPHRRVTELCYIRRKVTLANLSRIRRELGTCVNLSRIGANSARTIRESVANPREPVANLRESANASRIRECVANASRMRRELAVLRECVEGAVILVRTPGSGVTED